MRRWQWRWRGRWSQEQFRDVAGELARGLDMGVIRKESGCL